MSKTFIVTFTDVSSYESHKRLVIEKGGTIKNDLGRTLLGFVADIPSTLADSIRSNHLVGGGGIASFEEDQTVTILQSQ